MLFSSVVELMSLVVTQIRPSVHAANQALRHTLPVRIGVL
jgi:hypothetical protein